MSRHSRCKRGHTLSDSNIIVVGTQRRLCLICHRRRQLRAAVALYYASGSTAPDADLYGDITAAVQDNNDSRRKFYAVAEAD